MASKPLHELNAVLVAPTPQLQRAVEKCGITVGTFKRRSQSFVMLTPDDVQTLLAKYRIQLEKPVDIRGIDRIRAYTITGNWRPVPQTADRAGDQAAQRSFARLKPNGRFLAEFTAAIQASRIGQRSICANVVAGLQRNVQRNLAQYTEQLTAYRQAVAASKRTSGSDVMTPAAELERICRLPDLAELEIRNNRLLVETRPLYLQRDSGEWYKLGRILIVINLSAERFDGVGEDRHRAPHERRNYLSFWSLDGNECAAPHVFDAGYACFGTGRTTMEELFSSRKIYELLVYILKFLTHINEDDDDAVSKLDDVFPEVSAAEAKRAMRLA